jgi:ornithine carbamoyltransferase
MAFNLKNRSFLKEIDFEPRELGYLLKLSEALKMAKYAGTEVKHLEGKEIALIFENTSTRTRWRRWCSPSLRWRNWAVLLPITP